MKPSRRSTRRCNRHDAKQCTHPIEPCEDLLRFRTIFAEFLKSMAESVSEPCFFTVRGRHRWGLSLHLCITTRIFSALLIACDLVDLTKNTNGASSVSFSEAHWKEEFLGRYGLADGTKGHCEITKGRINYASLEDDRERRSTRKDDMMPLLRIGKYTKGEVRKATLQINDNQPPPSFSHKQRTAHRKLINDTRDIISKYLFHDRIDDVMNWVEMTDIYNPIKDNDSDSDDDDSDDDSDDESSCGSEMDVDDDYSKKPSSVVSKTVTQSSKNQAITEANIKSALSTKAQSLLEKMLVLSEQYHETHEELMAELAKDPRFQKIYSTTEVVMASEQTCSPTAITAATAAATAAATPVTNTATPITNHQEQFAAAATTAAAQVDTTALDRLEQFKLLASLSIPILNAPAPDSRFDIGQATRGNLLRQLTEYMESIGESPMYESENSLYEHNLIDFAKKKNSPNVEVKHGMKKLMSLSESQTKNIVNQLVTYLLTNHKDEFLAALHDKKLSPEKMDEYEVAATLSYAGIGLSQWEKIVQALKCFMSINTICVSGHKLRALGCGHGEIKTGTYLHTPKDAKTKAKTKDPVKEKIRFWYKNPAKEFESQVESIINGENIDPANIEHIKCCHGADHATKDNKGRFRVVSKATIRTKDDKEYSRVYSVADVDCKKDSSEVLDNSVMKPLVNGMNEVATGKIFFTRKDEDGSTRYQVELQADTGNEANIKPDIEPIKPLSFLTGDLEFLSIMLGRETFSGWWCMYCMLYKPEWQKKPSAVMQGLKIADLIDQHKDNKTNGHTGTDMKGVKMYPFVKEGTLVVFPVLHAMLGVGNNIMDYFFDEVDRFIEPISRVELAVRESIPNNEKLLEEEHSSLTTWMNSPQGGAELKHLETVSKQLRKNISNGLPNQQIHTQLGDIQSRIEALKLVQNKFESNIKKLQNEISAAKKKMKAFRTQRKITNSSLYNECERIFKKYKICRGAHHGGDFNGRSIITLMQQSKAIMEEIKTVFVENKRGSATEDDIVKLCTEVRRALVCWDDVFSKANTKYESISDDWVKEHCDATEKAVQQVMFQMRHMGFSITPKMHGLECHLMHQMRTVPGGISMLIEHWVEQYHQTAAAMERIWASHPYTKQAEFRVRREHMLSHKETTEAEARIVKSKRAQKRKKSEATVEEKNRIKAGRVEVKDEVQQLIDSTSAAAAAVAADGTEEDM